MHAIRMFVVMCALCTWTGCLCLDAAQDKEAGDHSSDKPSERIEGSAPDDLPFEVSSPKKAPSKSSKIPREEQGWSKLAQSSTSGIEVVVEAKKDKTDKRLNGDGSVFFKTQLALRIDGKRHLLPKMLYRSPGDGLDTHVAVRIEKKSDTAYVFAIGKTASADWGMEGFVFVLGPDKNWETHQVFVANSGWFPFFEATNAVSVRHFSFAGYFDQQLTLSGGRWTNKQVAALQPGEAKTRLSKHQSILVW